MRKRNYYYTLPDYLACYLINGDSDGLKKEEISEIDSFLKKERITIISKTEESFFKHSNDLNNLGCHCSTYIAHRITYKRTIDDILYPVGGRSGSPMGRRNVGSKPTDGTKVYDCLVPMSGYGDYDKGGAYWGATDFKHGVYPLRVSYTKDVSYIEFYRTR